MLRQLKFGFFILMYQILRPYDYNFAKTSSHANFLSFLNAN